MATSQQLQMSPLAPHHLPSFITAPDGSDWLMTTMFVFLVIVVVSVGLIYLRLHALPEHMAHRASKVQLQFVAVLALIALFTHNNVFWIAALLLALIDLPDFGTPMNSMARSLEKLAGRDQADTDVMMEPVGLGTGDAAPAPAPAETVSPSKDASNA